MAQPTTPPPMIRTLAWSITVKHTTIAQLGDCNYSSWPISSKKGLQGTSLACVPSCTANFATFDSS